MKVSRNVKGITEQSELLLALRIGKIEIGKKGRYSVRVNTLCTWVLATVEARERSHTH